MDNTETYIKMRLAAIPDLGMGTPMGFSINWQSEAILIDEKGDWYYSTKEEATQLERQDQLQILSGLGWREFDKECLKYDAETKEQAGIQVVIARLDKTTQ